MHVSKTIQTGKFGIHQQMDEQARNTTPSTTGLPDLPGLLLTVIGTLKFGFGALLLFELLAGAHFGQLKAGFCWILL